MPFREKQKAQINRIQTDSQNMDDALDDELKIFDFSHYPVPMKVTNITRFFYNNVNGLEINAAVEAVI